jgi:di/tricarboxylate transporter
MTVFHQKVLTRRKDDEYERVADFILALYTWIFKPHTDDEGGVEMHEVRRCEGG